MPSPCRARRPRKRAGGCSTSQLRAGTTSPDSRRRPHHPLRYSSNSRRPGAPRTARRPRSLGSRRHSGSARSRCSRGSRSAWRCPQARQTLAARWQRTRIDGSPDTCRPRRTRSKRSPRRRRSSRLHLLDEQPLAVARAPSCDAMALIITTRARTIGHAFAPLDRRRGRSLGLGIYGGGRRLSIQKGDAMANAPDARGACEVCAQG